MDEMKKMKMKKFGKFMFMAPLVVAGIFGMVYVVMWLWNGLLPEIFDIGTISYWQAAGLLALSRILFGGYGGGRGKHRHGCYNHRGGFSEKMENMTEDERLAFKESWKSKMC